MNLFKKPLKYYTGIDELPVRNWFKITETDDISHLLIHKRDITPSEKDTLMEAFENIYAQFIDAFGVNEVLLRVMELKRDITVLKLDMAITGNTSKITFIELKEEELRRIVSDSETHRSDNIKSYVDKFMGFYIDERTVSVRDYYGYIELLKQDIEQKEKQNVRQG